MKNKWGVVSVGIGLFCLTIGLLNGGFEAFVSFVNVIDHKIGSSMRRDIFYSKSEFAILALIEIVFLIIVFIELINKFKSLNKDSFNALQKTNLRSLRNAFGIIIISWILIYSWLGAAWYGLFEGSQILTKSSFVWSVADAFHGITIFGFFLAYISLTHPYLDSISKKEIKSFRLKYYLVISILILFACILSVMGRYYMMGLDKFGVLCLGVLSAFSMQYFIGVLDSRSFKFSHRFLAPLYFYVQLQIFWSTVDLIATDSTRLVVLVVALICKIYLFIFLYFWFHKSHHLKYI